MARFRRAALSVVAAERRHRRACCWQARASRAAGHRQPWAGPGGDRTGDRGGVAGWRQIDRGADRVQRGGVVPEHAPADARADTCAGTVRIHPAGGQPAGDAMAGLYLLGPVRDGLRGQRLSRPGHVPLHGDGAARRRAGDGLGLHPSARAAGRHDAAPPQLRPLSARMVSAQRVRDVHRSHVAAAQPVDPGGREQGGVGFRGSGLPVPCYWSGS